MNRLLVAARSVALGRAGTVVAATAVTMCMFAGTATPALAATGKTTKTTKTTESGSQKALAFAKAEVAYYEKHLPARLQANATAAGTTVDTSCFSAAYNHVAPDVKNGYPTNPAWFERDVLNQYCATLRLRDQFTSPAYGYEDLTIGDALWIDQLGQQIEDGPGHIHGGLTTLVPGSQAADPFRNVEAWEQQTGGSVEPVSFTASDGATLRGEVWLPPPGTPTLKNGTYPGVAITDGSVQAYENLYYWAAEGLAQYGYEVLTYDVQGQGDSDLLPKSCTPTKSDIQGESICPGVPYQQDYNFYQGAEDSLNFFLSTPGHPYKGTYNPGWKSLDRKDVALAGHSLGAEAVSWAGQCDKRVKAIVAWDDTVPVTTSQCAKNVTIPKADRATKLHAPALATTNDYEFNVEPQTKVPDPNGPTPTPGSPGSFAGGGLDGDAGYLSLVKAGVDSEIVSLRDATHLTYSYIPYVLPANEIGERIAFYYTLAWLDEYLRDGKDALLPKSDTAYKRLTDLKTFDRSSDYNDNTDKGAADIAIGAGTYSVAKAAADPTDPGAGNVPYEIKGIPIKDTLSFYYYSEYHLHDRGKKDDPLRTCTDMLAGCPAKQPSTP